MIGLAACVVALVLKGGENIKIWRIPFFSELVHVA